MVDLGNGKYLFALLKGASTLAQRTVVSRSAGPAVNAWFYHAGRVSTHLGKPAIIKSKQIPKLVTFTDINDPKTVKRVDPNDFDTSFGCPSVAEQASSGSASLQTRATPEGGAKSNKCYSLKAITLEITDEPVTKGLVKGVLGWLGKYPEPGLCKATGQSSNIPFCRRVHHGDFSRR